MAVDVAQQIRGQHRNHRQRQNQRAGQGENNRECDRHEKLSFEVLQRQQRQENRDDDENAGGDRQGDFAHRAIHQMQARQFSRARIMRQALHDIFHYHHGGIDQHADRNRQTAQAHQVRRHAESAHQNESDQRGQRQHQGHRQRRAHIAEEQAEQDHHQDRGFEQRGGDRAHGFIHQCGTIVEHIDRNTFGQGRLELAQLLLHAFHHLLRIGAGQPQHQALHGFVFAALRHHAIARQRADFDFGQIA